jgi:HD-GYP domain-containing protein (c-di-GMP phosphodiesterase class II)
VGLRLAADESCCAAVAELLQSNPRPVFFFTPGGVTCGALPLAEFDGWHWTMRLVVLGIERLELRACPDPVALGAFLDHLAALVPDTRLTSRLAPHGLRVGPAIPDPAVDDEEPYPLAEELTVVRQVFGAVSRGERISLGDVHAVVASLGAVVSEDEDPVLPLLLVENRDSYQPAHAINSALLSLVVADALGLSSDERRECGLAALLHDVGMARLPADLLSSERFTSQDRARIRGHPLEGARLLLRHSEALEGPAVVCYEHHLRTDGSGYPRLSYPREPHLLSRVVAICDAFDALLAPRPDRMPLDPAGALVELERNAGTHFDPKIVSAFSEMIMRSAGGGGLSLTSRPN